MDDQRHYAAIIIRTGISPRERKFLASIIAAERKGLPLTDRQASWLGSIVRKFQNATMRNEVIG